MVDDYKWWSHYYTAPNIFRGAVIITLWLSPIICKNKSLLFTLLINERWRATYEQRIWSVWHYAQCVSAPEEQISAPTSSPRISSVFRQGRENGEKIQMSCCWSQTVAGAALPATITHTHTENALAGFPNRIQQYNPSIKNHWLNVHNYRKWISYLDTYQSYYASEPECAELVCVNTMILLFRRCCCCCSN